MKKKLILFSIIFWWSIMFPVLNFTEKELVFMQKDNIQIKSYLMEILQ